MFYKIYDPKGKEGDDESDEYEESDYSINLLTIMKTLMKMKIKIIHA